MFFFLYKECFLKTETFWCMDLKHHYLKTCQLSIYKLRKYVYVLPLSTKIKERSKLFKMLNSAHD